MLFTVSVTDPETSRLTSPGVSDCLDEVGWIREEEERPLNRGIGILCLVHKAGASCLLQAHHTSLQELETPSTPVDLQLPTV